MSQIDMSQILICYEQITEKSIKKSIKSSFP